MTYRIAFAIICRIYACACWTRGHGLILVYPGMKLLFVFIVVYALDDFGSHERCLSNNAFQRHHVIQLVGAESARIDRELAKAANIGTVVYRILTRLGFRSVCKGLHNTLEGFVKCIREEEGLVKQAVGKLAIV